MWWHGRGISGGSWLLEDKKLICGTEGEIVVAHGRLPSPAHNKLISYLCVYCAYSALMYNLYNANYV